MMAADLQLIYYVVVFLWLTYLPVAATSLMRWLRNRARYLRTSFQRLRNDPHIIFQITTRSASSSDVVRRGIASIRAAASAISYSEYTIQVVTDDPKDASYLEGEGCEVIVVPRSYRTANGSIRKARALQYAVEHRRGRSLNTDKLWVYHMDEESYVTPQTLLSLLAFIQEGRGLVGEGPIVYPLKYASASRVTRLAESIRPFQCYDCVSQMTSPPPLHMHGSNLLVRADVEDEVGWDHGDTLAEDQLFGIAIYKRYGDVFGWHGGVLLEQPPLTVRDHFQQRRRWVIGILQNFKHLTLKMRLRMYLRAYTYWLGFLSAVASAAMYLYYFLQEALSTLAKLVGFTYVKPEAQPLPIMTPESIARSLEQGVSLTITWESTLSTVLGAALLFSFIVWLLSYQIGLSWNLRYVGMGGLKRLGIHIQQLLLAPIVGMVETFPAFYAVIEFYILHRRYFKDFYVVAK
jgi:egghead protein (zeste-white 4 protein)